MLLTDKSLPACYYFVVTIVLGVPPANQKDIRRITSKRARRVHRSLEKRISESKTDELLDRKPLLAQCYAAHLVCAGLKGGPRYFDIAEDDDGPVIRLMCLFS